MGNKWKKISLICVLAIVGVVLVNIFWLSPRLSGRKYVADFNQNSIDFHEEYKKLQEERVRLGALAYNKADEDKLLDQMDTIQAQAQRAYDELIGLYQAAWQIQKQGERLSFFHPAYAQEWAMDFVKNVLSATPIIGRLVKGFNSSTDHIRLGVYKAYYNIMKTGEEPDKEEIKAVFKKAGLKKPEDILTCPAKTVINLYRVQRHHIYDIRDEVNLAKVAAQQGASAVLGYFDGILVVTGVKEMDIAGTAVDKILDKMGVPSDIKNFVSIGLSEKKGGLVDVEIDVSKKNVKKYLKDKLKEKALEIYEDILTPKQIKILLSEDTKAKEELLEELKRTGEWGKEEEKEEEKSIIKTLLGVTKKAADIAKKILKEVGDLPYHLWPKEKQREAAEKLNQIEEPLMVSAKTKTKKKVTPYLIPNGIWDLIMSSAKKLPGHKPQVEKKPNQKTSLVKISADLANIANFTPGLLRMEVAEKMTLENLEEIAKGLKVEIKKKPGGLVVKIPKKDLKPGETVEVTIEIPESFQPPFNISTSVGKGALALPSRGLGYTVKGSFTSSEAGEASFSVTVTDALGNKVSGGGTITVSGASDDKTGDMTKFEKALRELGQELGWKFYGPYTPPRISKAKWRAGIGKDQYELNIVVESSDIEDLKKEMCKTGRSSGPYAGGEIIYSIIDTSMGRVCCKREICRYYETEGIPYDELGRPRAKKENKVGIKTKETILLIKDNYFIRAKGSSEYREYSREASDNYIPPQAGDLTLKYIEMIWNKL